MTIQDIRSPNRNYPIPGDPANTVADEFPRVATALTMIDTDVASLLSSVSQRALASHGHAVGDISGLQDQLDGKSGVGHTHTLDSLSDVSVAAPAAGQYLRFVGGQWVAAAVAATIGQVEGLSTALAGKADAGHTHAIANVTGLQDALNSVLGRYQNRVANGGFEISQERGTASVDQAGAGGVFVMDQWRLGMGAGTGVMRGQQIVGVAEPSRLRVTVQTADSAMASADIYLIDQFIEGQMLTDARFGQSNARPLILRFGVNTAVAGVYCVSVANGASDRSWVGTYTIAAGEVNTLQTRTLVIPGDVTGTWLRDTGIGLRLRFCLAAGSTFIGAAGWQAGNICATSAQVNFMAAVGATFNLHDVGLYVDSLGLGVAPPWEPPRYDDELRRCMRYWQAVSKSGYVQAAAAVGLFPYLFPVPMRVTPSRTLLAPGTVTNAIVSAEADSLSAEGFNFMIQSSGTAGSIFGRRDGFSARLA